MTFKLFHQVREESMLLENRDGVPLSKEGENKVIHITSLGLESALKKNHYAKMQSHCA